MNNKKRFNELLLFFYGIKIGYASECLLSPFRKLLQINSCAEFVFLTFPIKEKFGKEVFSLIFMLIYRRK